MPPGHALSHHGQADVQRLVGARCLTWFDPRRTDMPLVAIELVAAQLCLLLKSQLGQGLPGALSEWLLALWGIDALKPDFDRLIGLRRSATGRQGIAVRDADDRQRRMVASMEAV